MIRQRIASLARHGLKKPMSRTRPLRVFSSGPPQDVTIPGSASHFGSLGESPSHKSATSWQAEHNSDVQRVTQKAMIYELTQQQTKTIESVVPWFLENMPESYFRQVPEKFRMDHIKAISAVKDANMDLYLNLQSHLPDGRQVLTFIRPGTEPGTLLHMVEDFKAADDYLPLTRLHVFSTKDETMSLNMFVYGSKKDSLLTTKTHSGANILDLAEQVQRGEHDDLDASPIFERANLEEYLQNCSDNYIQIGANDPRRFLRQRKLFGVVTGTEGTAVHIEGADDIEGIGHYWVDVAVANSLPQVALELLCRLLYLHDFDVTRARLDVLPDGDNGTVTILRMLVAPVHDQDTDRTFDTLCREIKRAKWLDPSTMNLVFERYPHLGVTRGEVITAFCSLMHPVMAKENALAYSKANILETVTNQRFIQHAAAVADIFLDRFNPENPLSDDEYKVRCQELREVVKSDVEDTVASELFYKMMTIVDHTLKTNVYLPDRYSLALRLDPQVMVARNEDHRELPYGIVFSHGRRFNGFQIRFRDIARGGVRLVTPKSSELYALESARHYDECYNLAFAQQLKNKDIPEGGSKAVCLIDTVGMSDSSQGFVMRKSVKAFTDSILDLIVDTEETRENMVDRYGKKEVLYLGPDEQVIPDDINWIIRRAGYRGYETPAAFMSSKPRAGINHKEFGVTSEGVNVYLDVALRTILGIDPKTTPFTVKITGGPDGDVAGNELKILFREYGENAKVIGIADASGCAEHPDGLDHGELTRLVEMGLSIDHFDKSKLGSDGILHTVETAEGVKARNSMHNRLQADAFVPCGGRPGTIDIANYKQFLHTDGKPSSKLIVEGANLFITAEARQKLFEEAGVVIVKDSSANKGGVITSSYEICAAMLLSEDEFFDNKEQIVGEVLDKLRGLAQMEAELLFREFENFGGSLPEASQIISNCINVATDALSVALDNLTEEDRKALLPLFRAHLPKTLADMSFEHVHERVPAQYIKNAISSCMASKLVYKEGTKFIAAQPPEKLAQIALKYMEKEKEIAVLVESLEGSNLSEEEKMRIVGLLEAGGARTALQVY
jgi:glutamate dehydrogenase